MDKVQPDLINGTDMTILYHPFKVAAKNQLVKVLEKCKKKPYRTL